MDETKSSAFFFCSLNNAWTKKSNIRPLCNSKLALNLSYVCVRESSLYKKRKLAPIVSGKHDLIHLPRSHCFVHQCGREGGKNKGKFHVCVGCERTSHTLRRRKKRYTTNGINPIKRVANNERISLCAAELA
jgi:hypothetical protein